MMPEVQYCSPREKINIVKTMPVPKKVTDLYGGWYKEARRAIPSIPDRTAVTIVDEVASLDFVKFELVDRLGIKSYIVINRRICRMSR